MPEEAEPTITITLRRSEAEAWSYGLSDLLCWCRGFSAALLPDDFQRHPMGVDEARELNIKLKAALK